MQLSHIHLLSTNLSRSVAFYVDNLRLRYFGRQIIDRARYITDHWMPEGTEIAFVRDDLGGEIAIERAATVAEFPAWFHFGFLLSSEAEVEELYSRMQSNGVPLRKLTREGQILGFRAYDPDRYLLEFCYDRVRDPVNPGVEVRKELKCE
jgi:catechol 2,3-dioxygenase-like lactoylglutathione lyase family enzyme